jgi:integrase
VALLRDFFERVFLPLHLNGDTAYASVYRSAINWFADALGEEPELGDLTARNVSAMMLHMIDWGAGCGTVRQTRVYLCSMWRCAYRYGLVNHYEAVATIERQPDQPRRKEPVNKLPPLPAAEPGTVRYFFETAYRPVRMIDCKPDSIEQARAAVRSLRDHYGRDILLTEQTDELAADHFAWLLKTRGIEAISVNHGYRAYWFAVWRLAYERRLVDRIPTVRKLRHLVCEPDAWSEEEAARIVEAARRVRLPAIAGIPARKFWPALLLVDWWTAVRRGSLFSIRRADVDFSTGWLEVFPRGMKTRRGKKYHLGDDAIAAVKEIWLPAREFLFPWPYRREATVNHFRQILAIAGITKGQRKGLNQFHKWRRTAATAARRRGGLAAASELLGHSSTAMTLRYIDPSKVPGTDATKFLPSLTAGERRPRGELPTR